MAVFNIPGLLLKFNTYREQRESISEEEIQFALEEASRLRAECETLEREKFRILEDSKRSLGLMAITNEMLEIERNVLQKKYDQLFSDHATRKHYDRNLEAERDLLREELARLRNDICQNDNDTVWVGDAETACDRITGILQDSWEQP